MVSKINIGNSLYGSLKYNTQKVEKGVAKVLGTNKIFNPSDGNLNLADCLRDFESYTPLHHKVGSPVVHISLNPHPDDRLSDERYLELAEEYLRRMGYGDQPYVIFKHEDLKRHHLHIISLRVDAEGRKIDDSFEHRRSMKITRDLEREFGLVPSGQQRKEVDVGEPARVDVAEGDVRDQIARVILPLAGRYNFLSFNEYRALLSLYNISAEEVKGEVNGRRYFGVVYSATDDKGNKIGNHFNSSEFGLSVGYEALHRRFESSKVRVKEGRLAQQTKQRVADILRQSSSRDEFERRLCDAGVDVIFRESDAGRLYGATYIDHNNQSVFNGSRLGRELSANALSEWFENPQILQPEPQQLDTLPTYETYEESFSLGGLFDLPLDGGGDDLEDENLANKMLRKRKKQRRVKF